MVHTITTEIASSQAPGGTLAHYKSYKLPSNQTGLTAFPITQLSKSQTHRFVCMQDVNDAIAAAATDDNPFRFGAHTVKVIGVAHRFRFGVCLVKENALYHEDKKKTIMCNGYARWRSVGGVERGGGRGAQACRWQVIVCA